MPALGKVAVSLGVRRDSFMYARASAVWGSAIRRHGRRSWSQSAEDLVLSQYLPERSGHYVDVGAGHPVEGSNTYFLWRRGWRGILVEANPGLARQLIRKRRGDVVVNALAGEDSGTGVFFEYANWQLGTMDLTRVMELANEGLHPTAERRLGRTALATLGLACDPLEPSLLSVDVEEADLQVLRGNDWTTYKPRVVCVEELYVRPDQQSDVRDLLRGEGYWFMGQCVSSSIFVHESFVRATWPSTRVV